MKNLIISITSLLIVNLAPAQDTIYERNGNVINAKVTEVTQAEIKYKKTSNPDGPVYTMDKNEVTLIQYKNGSKDVFASNSNSPDINRQNQQTPVVNNTYNQNNSNGYGYSYSGSRVRIYVSHPPFFRPPGFNYSYYRPHRHGHRHRWW